MTKLALLLILLSSPCYASWPYDCKLMMVDMDVNGFIMDGDGTQAMCYICQYDPTVPGWRFVPDHMVPTTITGNLPYPYSENCMEQGEDGGVAGYGLIWAGIGWKMRRVKVNKERMG